MFPASMVLIDTSADTRLSRLEPQARADVESLAARYLHATCPLVELEIGYTARNASEYGQMMAAREELLIHLPFSAEVISRAMTVQRLLAARGQHRVAGGTDLLIAATAEVHGATLLHYDRDFDYIAAVTGQPARWVAEPGSLP